MRRGLLAIIGIGVVGALLWRTNDGPPTGRTADAPTALSDNRAVSGDDDLHPAAPTGPGVRAEPRAPVRRENLSFADADPDGSLLADDHGHFIITPESRRFFDHFLTATGEAPTSTLRTLIIDEIRKRLAEPAASQAIEALDAYLRYRRRAERLVRSGDVPESLEERLRLIREIRRETLGDDAAEVWFGDEERMQEADLARRRALSDPSLSERERQEVLSAIERQLPERVREARAAAFVPQRLADDEAALVAAGGSDEEVHALREQVVGAEAAARLAALDRERARWQERLTTYRVARAALEAAPDMDAADRKAALATLLAEHFDERERIRVRALDAATHP